MPAHVTVAVRKSPDFDSYLNGLPLKMRGIASESIADYVVGDERHGLKHEPNYLFVTRTAAYGEPFSSLKQQRWFFGALRRGEITPGRENRTHAIANGWHTEGDRTRTRIVNDEEGVQWVMGKRQAAQPRMAGWRYYLDVIRLNMKGAIRHANAEIRKELAKRRSR